jgi:hypothetical protein
MRRRSTLLPLLVGATAPALPAEFYFVRGSDQTKCNLRDESGHGWIEVTLPILLLAAAGYFVLIHPNAGIRAEKPPVAQPSAPN